MTRRPFRRSFFLPLSLAAAALAPVASAQDTPQFTLDPEPGGREVVLRLSTPERVLGGSVGFVLDPDLGRVTGVRRGNALIEEATLVSSLFDNDAAGADGVIPVTDPRTPLDAADEPVPGGIVFGWIAVPDSEDPDVGTEPGEGLEIAVFIVEPDADGTVPRCREIVPRPDLRTSPGLPAVGTLVTDVDGQSVPATLLGAEACLCEVPESPARVFCPCPPPPVGPPSLPPAVEGERYGESLAVDAPDGNLGGTLVWSVRDGTPPPGLELAEDGVLRGVPQPGAAGSWSFRARVCGTCDEQDLCTAGDVLLEVEAPPVAAAAATAPSDAFVDDGRKAVAFTLQLDAPPGGDDLELLAALFEDRGMTEAGQVARSAQLVRDDGDGVLDGDDTALPGTGTFDADGRLALEPGDTTWPAGETLRLFLVLDLVEDARPRAAVLGPAAWLAALLLAFAVARGRGRWAKPLSRTLAAGALLVVPALIPACGGDGGSGGTSGSATGPEPLGVQLELSALDVRGSTSGAEVTVDGLPIEGPSI